MTYYVIYKTKNNVNGKYYIGKHSTDDVDDHYLGSGLLLQEAIKKYGVKNFSKEILFYCDSKEELDRKEKEIVNQELVLDPNTYNIALGGQGGNLGRNVNQKIGKSMSRALTGKKKSKKHIESISRSKKGHTVSENTKKAIGKKIASIRQNTDPESTKKLFAHYGEKNGFYGRTHTLETKEKIRTTIGDSRKGSKNSRAKPIVFRGKTFGCKKDCAEYFNLSKYMLNKLLGETNG